jgi:hypothetical protein
MRRSTGLIADQYVLPIAAREGHNAVIALVCLLRQTCRDCMSRRGGEGRRVEVVGASARNHLASRVDSTVATCPLLVQSFNSMHFIVQGVHNLQKVMNAVRPKLTQPVSTSVP